MVHSRERKGFCPDSVHPFIDVLSKIRYVNHGLSIVEARIDQVIPKAFEH